MYKNFRRLLVIYKGARGPFIVSQTFLAFSVLLNLAIVALNGTLVNDGVQQGNIEVVISTAVWMIGLTLIQTIFALGNSLYAVLFAEGTANFLRVGTYRKIQTLSFGNLDRFRTSDLLVRLTSDINNVKQAVLYGILLLFQAPFMIVMAVAMAIFLLPSLLWLMIVIMVVVSVVLFFLLRGVQQMFVARQQALDGVNNVLQEALAGVRVVKAFVRERFEMQRFAKVSNTWLDAALSPAYRMALFVPSLQLIVYTGTAALYYFGGQGVFGGTTNLGEIVVFSNVLSMVVGPMAMLAFIIPFLESGEASCGRVFEILDEEAEIQDRATAKPVDVSNIKGRIVFENASFGYRDRAGKTTGLVLEKINLTIEPGQTVGFLGATGSGKSTLVNLIPRFYDVLEGKVTIDGINVCDLPQRQLHQIVGMALQESVLFSGTVRGNILFSRPDLDDDEMVAAAQAADADSFVSRIPEQYDAPVSRRGTNFSGGQRQRLAIARALASRPPIVILDDSTSALDMATEARVQEAVQDLMSSSTKLYVAQRISTVLTADKIVLLEHGRQVAVGTHAELIQTSPLYREIYESQLGKLDEQPERIASPLAGQSMGGTA
ncbi:ABC transporter ATP-binding protein [Candidatus Chloroploca sp. M-50]|uniref:ABC transporter ATP-binding protein n=1 Tax=Candidatus Chloroploca mongolica TaxID=2528176 RepID=A0ABS4DGG1_9CHLR|nr:ABC transporter ATP-binding protein [Candidatus Chloroploca mongolica]MBP1468529.1 ABC transporter ATP-binding protein [Candidatus Chloroploca mongolica]